MTVQWSLVQFDSFYDRVSTITAVLMIGHRLKFILTNGPRFIAPGLPWWSTIQVVIEVDVLNFSKRATELALDEWIYMLAQWRDHSVIHDLSDNLYLYSNNSSCVPWLRKHGYYRWNFLLSWERAEIYVISYLLPVNGRHIWFTTYPYIREYPHLFLCVFWHRKRGIAVEIVLISCTFAEICIITLIQPPSCISDCRFNLAVLLITPLKSMTLKTSR